MTTLTQTTISNYEEAQYELEAQHEALELETQLDAEYVPTPITKSPVAEAEVPEWLKDEPQDKMINWGGQLFHEDDCSDAAAMAVLGY